MKKIYFLLLMILIGTLSFASTLENLTFSSTQNHIITTLIFDSIPNWKIQNQMGNQITFVFQGKISASISNKISWKDMDLLISTNKSTSNIIFTFPFVVSASINQIDDHLEINFTTLGISQNLPLTGPASKISIDFSGQQGSNFSLAIKYLSRILNRNLIIDPSIANNPVNITLKNVTPAEAFYDIMISSPGIGYAILPDGTYYIAPVSVLIQNFGKLGTGTYNNVVSFYNLSSTNISSQDFKNLVENLFGQNKIIGNIGSYQIVNATVEQQKTIEDLMNFVKESESFKAIQWSDQSSVKDLESLISMMYPNLKITYLPSFSTLLLSGGKSDIDGAYKVIGEYGKIIESIGPKITVPFVLSSQNAQTFIQFAKNFAGITIYGSPTNNSTKITYLAMGPKNRIYEFAKAVSSIASTLVSVSPQVMHFNFVSIPNDNTFLDLSKVISIIYPEVKMTYLPSLGEALIYGTDSTSVDQTKKFIENKTYSSTSTSITNIVTVRNQDYQTVKSLIEANNLTMLGPSKPSTSSTVTAVAIVGSESAVNKLTSLLSVSGLIQSKVREVGQTANQIVEVRNGLITLSVKDYPLYDLIQRVYAALSKNIVFAYQNLPNVTLDLSNVTLDQFDQTIGNSYGLSFSGTAVTIVDKNTTGLTRIYTVSGNVDQIVSLAKFLGGNVYSDPNTGIVVVNGLSQYAANVLDNEMQKLQNPRPNVQIMAKIVDVTGSKALSDSVNSTLITPQLIFNNGLNLSFNLLNASNPSNFVSGIADQILSSKATITANFSKTTGEGSVLSAPTLMTQSGEPAQITIGEQYPYLVTTVVNSQTGQTAQQLQFLTTGIQLNILPVVLSNGQISLTITIQVSDADWGHAVNGVPAVVTRNASVKVVISSGQTLLIGGLTKQNRSENVTKIPFLGDLPFIGQFFTSTTFQDSTDNLDIFITASVVK
ncbi:MAG: type II secretion system protein GspD [Athalassotoga sp.]|uniref:type II secretion system protein GspD n=1 Tax=Athalassotoga sp. TaxID=2022597 RepID=UPI003D071A9F